MTSAVSDYKEWIVFVQVSTIGESLQVSAKLFHMRDFCSICNFKVFTNLLNGLPCSLTFVAAV